MTVIPQLPGKRSAVALALCLIASPQLFAAEAETTPKKAEVEVEEDRLVTIGTRLSGRTNTDTPAPVDIISGETLRAGGETDLAVALRQLAPSFNYNTTTTSDGQDLVRPASLRSMGPDQVLVLVNGKRRHQQALVAVQHNVGRGSAGTDLNAIPITAVQRIEILRDGAAALYGSDAIGGVINIVLKDSEGSSIWSQYQTTSKGDGTQKLIGAHAGLAFGEASLNLSVEWADKEQMNRATPTTWGGSIPVPRIVTLVGDAEQDATYGWFNFKAPVAGGEFYAFGGLSERESVSLGFFRPPGSGRNIDSIFPNGVTPALGLVSDDTSVVVGWNTDIGSEWTLDMSYSFGENTYDFYNRRSLNVSFGPNSPTSAYDGGLEFNQEIFNLDIAGDFDAGHLAVGAEFRTDGYVINAGEEVSYLHYPIERGTGMPCTQDSPVQDPSHPGCTPSAPGMQGFAGYRPEQELDKSRESFSLYADWESQLTDAFAYGLALRYEDYSDFGDKMSYRISGLYTVNDDISLRANRSTGFRAPGVQQQYFTQRSITSSGTQLIDSLTISPGSDLANQLGFYDLKEEESLSHSMGIAYAGPIWTSTFDVYRIEVDDRIVFSRSLSKGAVNAEVDAVLNSVTGLGAVNTFTNAVDTQTDGFDWVNIWRLAMDGYSLQLEASLHMNNNTVTGLHTSSSIVPASVVFGPGQETLLEDAQPARKAVFGATWKFDNWGITGRANYYGEVSAGPQSDYTLKRFTWGAKTIFDLVGNYRVTEHFRIDAGILNAFNTYPDSWNADVSDGLSTLGFKYGWESLPFGLAGRQYYIRGEYTF